MMLQYGSYLVYNIYGKKLCITIASLQEPNMIPWYKRIDPSNNRLPNLVNIVKEASDNIRYFAMHTVPEYRCFSNMIKKRTMLSALKYGSVQNCHIWAYANSFYPETVKDKYGRYRTEHKPRSYNNWVLDLDGCRCETIQELKEKLVSLDLKLPNIIVQTSPYSFHCLFVGGASLGERQEYCEKFAGIYNLGINPEYPNYLFKMRDAGVDWNYVKGDNGWHKIRVPGSINHTYFVNNKKWVCEGWQNEETIVVEKKVVRVSYKEKRAKRFESKYEDKILELLDKILGKTFKDIREDLAKKLSKNVGWLIEDVCKICQEHWGKEMGISQALVSKIVRTLVKVGVLRVINDNYKISGFGVKGVSKVYGAGEKLREVIGKSKGTLSDGWEDGRANEMMLNDIRVLASRGIDVKEAVDILDEKQEGRGRKRRSRRELERTFERWVRRVDSRWEEAG